ncbi:GtrA family protein [Tabrizicola soli]|uniref:GtrA family protein n=1 Tax=Tabrizicola soli TaxID=2185115 RepID=A0ABV7DSC0_9RHOB|nr:GtrA family protein [Tabrizicola soli]
MLGQLIRFGGVGGLATLAHVLVALAAGAVLGFQPQGANLAGFLASVLLSYFGHARFTFSRRAASIPQFLRFAVQAILALATSSATVALGTTVLGLGLPVVMAAVALVVPAASYLAMRFWVFDGHGEAVPLPLGDLMLCALLALAVAAVFWDRPANHDVAWYLVASRAWQAGAELYTDLVEVNPPLNFYLTLPTLWIADALGVSDTNGHYLAVALLLFASLTWSAALLRRDGGLTQGQRALLLVVTFLAVMLPSLNGLGQRDQTLVLSFLPWALTEALPRGATRASTLASALFAAVGMCLKPHFVLLPLAVTALNCIERRSLRPVLAPANLVFLLAGLAYIAFVRVQHPAYFTDTVALALQVYGAYAKSLFTVLSRIDILLGLVVLTFAVAWRRQGMDRPARVFAALAAGGLASYLLQGTGFSYHKVPFLAFSSIACCLILLRSRVATAQAVLSLVTVLAVWLGGVQKGFYRYPAVTEIVAAVEGLGPFDGVITLSSHVYTGPPVALALGTSWASGYSSQWLVPGAINRLETPECRVAPDHCEPLRRIAARNRSDILRDMKRNRPQLMIVDRSSGYFDRPGFDWLAFMAGNPAWPPILAEYRQVAATGRFLYFLRHTEKTPP